MEEQEFKNTYRAINEAPCPFEKAILSTRCGCEKSRKLNIAEREAVGCSAPAARQDCLALLEAMRRNAMFALKLTAPSNTLPHSKEMRVQCGGMLGLRNLVFPDDATELRVENIYAVVAAAQALHGSLDALPYGEIVKQIAAFEPRPRRR
jgi:hypothetical protein